MVSVTSARPRAGRADVPANTTSSILPPRSDLAPCWPITQVNASTTLDLPEPLGPTTHVIPGSNLSVVVEAKDLKPRNVRVFRYTACFSSPSGLLPVRIVVSLRRLPRNLPSDTRNAGISRADGGREQRQPRSPGGASRADGGHEQRQPR